MEDSSSESFGFAFNDSDFSDRVLHIEITTADESLPPKLKKFRFTNSPPQTHSSAGFQLKTLHLSSVILAAKSPFFFKLFKNGMISSQQKEATLRIYSSEEIALMELLKFMYTNILSATSCSDLLDVLMAADKFEVKSCIKHCIRLLLETPMSLEFAILYLELPLTALVVEPLIDASKQYLVARFGVLHGSEEEAMKLPLSALEIILDSDGLQVDAEDCVYDFILKWGHKHYPKLKERREILTNHMVHFLNFPYMSSSKLKQALACPYFDHEHMAKLVMEALFIKDQLPYGQHLHTKTTTTTKSRRLYKQPPVKVVHLEFHSPRAIIYFNLKKEDIRTLYSSGWIQSQPFNLIGDQWFCLVAYGSKESPPHFGMYLIAVLGAKTGIFDLDFAVMKKPSNRFASQRRESFTLSKEVRVKRWDDLFGVSWNAFMGNDSEYFVDDILHLQVDIIGSSESDI